MITSNNNHRNDNSWATNDASTSTINGSVTPPPASPLQKELHRLPSYYLEALLGSGPVRFAPHDDEEAVGPKAQERQQQQQQQLTPTNQRALENLQRRWNEYCVAASSSSGGGTGRKDGRRKRNKKNTLAAAQNLSVDWFMRFLYHTARKDGTTFHEDRAFRAMTKSLRSDRYVKLRVFSMMKQLQSKTLFPVPGLKTKGGGGGGENNTSNNLSMFYMRPSRYFPKQTSTSTIIDNLVYVMNTMLEGNHQERAQKEGIGFIACMDDWKFENFEVNYCYQFMMALQGAMVPVKVQLFLIVNPPAWFGAIWKLMRPMLAPSFRRKVKICNEDKISEYLQDDYQKYLPDDFATGKASTKDLVADFITYRRYVERNDGLGYVSAHNPTTTNGDDEDCRSRTSDEGFSSEGSYDHHCGDEEIDLAPIGQGGSHNTRFNHSMLSDTNLSMATSNSSYSDHHHDDDDDDASIHADIDIEAIDREIEEEFLDTGW